MSLGFDFGAGERRHADYTRRVIVPNPAALVDPGGSGEG
jgi:hypothetical protein